MLRIMRRLEFKPAAWESHNKHDQPQQELLAHAAPDLRVEGGDW